MNINKQILVTMIVAVSIVATIIFSGCRENIKVKEVEVAETEMQLLPAILMFSEGFGMTFPNIQDKTIVWTSSNPNIATVELWGVSAHARGETIITGKTEDGKITTSPTTVIVKPNVIAGDYATEILCFYGETKTDKERKWVTVKYHSKNKIIYSIDEKFQISQTGNIECFIKAGCIADVTKIKDEKQIEEKLKFITKEPFSYEVRVTSYKAIGETFVTIKGTSYPASIEGVFTNTSSEGLRNWDFSLDMVIKIKNVPEIGDVLITFEGFGHSDGPYSHEML